MIKTLIIDDEQHCIDRIVDLLSDYKDYSIIGKVQTINEALDATIKLAPDLIFLDIHINRDSAFDYLRQIQTKEFDIIFTTAHDKYAVQAFKFSALDYLLKPITEDDFREAIFRYTSRLTKYHFDKRMDVLIHNLDRQASDIRISIPTQEGYEFYDVREIVRCQADGGYTHIIFRDGHKLTVAKTLKSFEELLSIANFYRIHNAHLINIKYLKKYIKGKGGYVVMSDSSMLEVSTRRKDEFLRFLG